MMVHARVADTEEPRELVLQNDNAQAILLIGDLSYADDYNGHSTGQRNGYQPRWDTWGQMMQPIISHLPFLSVMGENFLHIYMKMFIVLTVSLLVYPCGIADAYAHLC